LALRRFPSLYDVTHVHNLHGGYLSLRAVHRLCERMPVVWSLHDEFAVTGGLPGDFSRVMDRSEILATWGSVRGMVKDDGKSDRYYAFVDRWMPRPAALVCHSKYILGLVRACPRWRLTPAHLARIPVPMQHEPASRGDRGAAKSRFGFGRAEPVVLMAANHFAIPHKGMAFGARALGLLPRDRFRVLLIGGGAEDVARQIPQASMCPGSIRSTEEMAWAYRAADVTLVPSVVESFGLVAAESMACETPVVGFRVGGLPELAGEGSRGLLAPPLDTAELAANVRRLLDDPELRRRLGVAGRDWIAANCDADRSFERVFEIYAEAQATFRTSRGAAPVTTP
jgi:glycosyltransferase involved in cell wall biosynthesis